MRKDGERADSPIATRRVHKLGNVSVFSLSWSPLRSGWPQRLPLADPPINRPCSMPMAPLRGPVPASSSELRSKGGARRNSAPTPAG